MDGGHTSRSKAGAAADKYTNTCLIDAFRALGIKVPYERQGPHWILADGLEILQPHGYVVQPVARIHTARPGRFVVCSEGHAIAVRCHADFDVGAIDRRARNRLGTSALARLSAGAAIVQV